jgi:UDP-N-acetylmuramoyl-tripeptide--D-alanyl-D-alanine ligase
MMGLPSSLKPLEPSVGLTVLPNGEKVATFTLANLLLATQGTIVYPASITLADSTLFAPLTDNRGVAGFTFPAGVQPLFIPLVGETFDGHQFLPQLEALDIAVCLANESFLQSPQAQEWLASKPVITIVSVPDTLLAFQGLARFHRQRIATKIVGLTGSSGKTTVKELLAFGLSAGFAVQATEKNFNNDIGVAKTLLAIAPETQVAIVEMGMRGLGEISRLAHTALPDVGLLLNVGPAHIGRLGSLEAIAQAKCELAEGVQEVLVSNGDDPLIQQRLSQLSLKIPHQTHFSLSQAEALTPLSNGCFQFSVAGVVFQTTLPGEHQVRNCLAVIAVASVLGLPLQPLADKLVQLESVAGRFESVALGGKARLINDAYNANPSSMNASLQAFLKPSETVMAQILVLGTMQELGEFERDYHEALLTWLVQQAGVTALAGVVFIGKEAPSYEAFLRKTLDDSDLTLFPVLIAETVDGASQQLPQWITNLSLSSTQPIEWLLKGSRSHGLERLVSVLQTVYTSN